MYVVFQRTAYAGGPWLLLAVVVVVVVGVTHLTPPIFHSLSFPKKRNLLSNFKLSILNPPLPPSPGEIKEEARPQFTFMIYG